MTTKKTSSTRGIISSDASQPLTTSRFARKFLNTLMKMKRSSSKPPSPYSSSGSEIRRRAHRIKLASYHSMALAVGSRRAWSRALILKLSAKRKSQLRSLSVARRARATDPVRLSRKLTRRKFPRKKKQMGKESDTSGVDQLRQLVPGGELMDLSSLFEETAHFVQCLETQVRVMRSVVDRLPC